MGEHLSIVRKRIRAAPASAENLTTGGNYHEVFEKVFNDFVEWHQKLIQESVDSLMR